MRSIFVFFSLLLLATGSKALGNSVKKSETIDQDKLLDRLERKLLEQEASSLKLSPPPPAQNQGKTQAKGPVQTFEMPSSLVAAPLPQSSEFDQIEKDIRGMEQDIDELSGQIEKLKTAFMQSSELANFIELKIVVEQPELVVLRDLAFAIDQHRVFQFEDKEGQWVPGSEYLLYSGPLEPGDHVIELKAKVMRRSPENLPIDQNLFHVYEQKFSLKIPEGKVRKGYAWRLTKPEKQNLRAEAEMEAYAIP